MLHQVRGINPFVLIVFNENLPAARAVWTFRLMPAFAAESFAFAAARVALNPLFRKRRVQFPKLLKHLQNCYGPNLIEISKDQTLCKCCARANSQRYFHARPPRGTQSANSATTASAINPATR
jgi:hypothetical protein